MEFSVDFHGRSIRRVGTDRTRNSDTLCLMAKLLQNLTQDITKKNIELQQLKSLFDGVKVTSRDMYYF